MANEKSVKLTKTKVDELKLEDGKIQDYVWDSELKGFGVRLNPSSKTYIVQGRDVTGKTCRATIGRHGVFTAEQARKEAIKKLGEMAGGVNLNAVKKEKKAKTVTLNEAWEQYKKSRDLRPATIKVYQFNLSRNFEDWLDKPVSSITKDMVEKRHRKISTTEGPRSNAGGSQAQANQAMRTLRSILNFAAGKFEDAEGRSILPENPVKRLSQNKSWNKNTRRQSVIHKSQIKDWYAAVKSLETDAPASRKIEAATMRDYLLLCIFTGLRRNEAASLTWDNVNLEDGYLKIDGDLDGDQGGSFRGSKNHQEHRLPLSDILHKLLSERKLSTSGKYVFPGRGGPDSHLVESKFSVAKVIDRSKVPFMVHDLRRTFLTIAEGLDVPHYALKRLANHKNSGDVTAGYIVNDVERLRAPMQAITDFILEQAGERQAKSLPVVEPTTTKRLTDTHNKLEVVG